MEDSKTTGSEITLCCPKCTKETKYASSKDLQCSECSTDFNGMKLVKKKTGVLAMFGLSIILGVGAKSYSLGSSNAKSSGLFEGAYVLMDQCVAGDMGWLNSYQLREKINQCGCALEEAYEELSDREDGVSMSRALIDGMSRNLKKC